MFIVCVVLIIIIVFILGFVFGLKFSARETLKIKKLSDKYLELFKIAVKWIKDYPQIEDAIKDKGHKRIAIYGMSYLGDCLEHVLVKNGIGAVYGIDKNADKLYNPHIPIYSMENDLSEVDLIIVTTVVCGEEIKRELEAKVNKNTEIIFLEDVLYNI